MDTGFILGLSAITLAVIGLLLFLGLKLSKAAKARAPDSQFTDHINLSGTILFAIVVAFWIICMVARELYPSSAFGAFLRNPKGLLIALVWSIFLAGVFSAMLAHLGYPITRRHDDD